MWATISWERNNVHVADTVMTSCDNSLAMNGLAYLVYGAFHKPPEFGTSSSCLFSSLWPHVFCYSIHDPATLCHYRRTAKQADRDMDTNPAVSCGILICYGAYRSPNFFCLWPEVECIPVSGLHHNLGLCYRSRLGRFLLRIWRYHHLEQYQSVRLSKISSTPCPLLMNYAPFSCTWCYLCLSLAQL